MLHHKVSVVRLATATLAFVGISVLAAGIVLGPGSHAGSDSVAHAQAERTDVAPTNTPTTPSQAVGTPTPTLQAATNTPTLQPSASATTGRGTPTATPTPTPTRTSTPTPAASVAGSPTSTATSSPPTATPAIAGVSATPSPVPPRAGNAGSETSDSRPAAWVIPIVVGAVLLCAGMVMTGLSVARREGGTR